MPHRCTVCARHRKTQDEYRIRAVRMRLAMWLCRCRRVRMLIHRNLSSLSGYQVSLYSGIVIHTVCCVARRSGKRARHRPIHWHTPSSRSRVSRTPSGEPSPDSRCDIAMADAPRAHTRDTVFAFAGTSPGGAGRPAGSGAGRCLHGLLFEWHSVQHGL